MMIAEHRLERGHPGQAGRQVAEVLLGRGHRPAGGWGSGLDGDFGERLEWCVLRHDGWLGISKQAAGKTIDRLEELGYVRRAGDGTDRRRKLIRLTPRGVAALAMSAMIFGDIRSRWEAALGPGRLAELESDLRSMAPGETFRLDVPGWFGGYDWRDGQYGLGSAGRGQGDVRGLRRRVRQRGQVPGLHPPRARPSGVHVSRLVAVRRRSPTICGTRDLGDHEHELAARRTILTHVSADMLSCQDQARYETAHDGLILWV